MLESSECAQARERLASTRGGIRNNVFFPPLFWKFDKPKRSKQKAKPDMVWWRVTCFRHPLLMHGSDWRALRRKQDPGFGIDVDINCKTIKNHEGNPVD